MTGVISNKTIIILVLTTLIEIAATIDEDEMRGKCKKQVEECSITNECFKDAMTYDFDLKSMCDNIGVQCGMSGNESDLKKVSLYAYEKCSFWVPSDEWQYYSENRTYSVFIGDDDNGVNMKPVNGCCNLLEKSECLMPPTRNKTKKFFAVFAQNGNVDVDYCYKMLEYSDIPIEECEKGKKIVDPCWDLEDGYLSIKYSFQLLDGRTEMMKRDANYFTFPSSELPAHLTFNFEKYTRVDRSLINVTCTNESDAVVGTRRISTCRLYHDVTSAADPGIVNEIYEPENGDLTCFDISNPGINSEIVRCKSVKVAASKLIWQIGIPIAAFIVLIIIVSAIRLRRVLQKISKEKKDLSALKFTPESSDFCPESPNSLSHQTAEPFEQNLDEFNDDMEQLESQTEKGQESESLHLLRSSERISCDKLEQISLKDGETLSTEKSTDHISIVECGYILKGPLIAKSPDTSHKRIDDKLKDTKLNIDGSDYSSGYIPKYLTTD